MNAKRFIYIDGFEDNGEYITPYHVVELLNEQHETIQRLKQNIDELLSINVEEELLKENEELKQAYAHLKHRHSLLHDVCIDAECDRDSYRKDIASLEKENEQLRTKNNAYIQDIEVFKEENTHLKLENEQLKSQLYCDEEGVCNICKHHYLVKDDEVELAYYTSRCKKGHYECARVSLKHCEDFEKELK